MKAKIIVRDKSGQKEKELMRQATRVLQNPPKGLEIYESYDVTGITEEEKDEITDVFFPAKEFDREEEEKGQLKVAPVAGQFDRKEQALKDLFSKYTGKDLGVVRNLVFRLEGETEEFIDWYLNETEVRRIEPGVFTEEETAARKEDGAVVEGFREFTKEEMETLSEDYSFTPEDLLFCRDYFIEENRDPFETELKVIDTYWSDHCRHSTFNTELMEVSVEEGPYKKLLDGALERYREIRKEAGDDKPESLMDLGTVGAKYLKSRGGMKSHDVSEEVNACSVEIEADVDGKKEPWLFMFKNETHNHPTEIEPYGGASTCIGGGIRDPLSGRSICLQGMRITGSPDPLEDFEKTPEEKLSPMRICNRAAEGFSDYANDIGLPSGYTEEFYHPGYRAKRLECGALVAAAPKSHVVRKTPTKGDLVLILGGRTGKDGLGAAVGSSKVQTKEKDFGAEVQKGNPIPEQKIMRLFRREEATRLIKRCNDFGAGGVAVAVGEIADGLSIDLDKVPLKYPWMSGEEILLSESQERMAVVIAPEDAEEFEGYLEEEDILYEVIATVTGDRRMKAKSDGKVICDLSRDFLDTGGATGKAAAKIAMPQTDPLNTKRPDTFTDRSLGERFDATVGGNTVLYPYGGVHKKTKEVGMAAKLPTASGNTDTATLFAASFDPYVYEVSPYHGGYYAVVDAAAKILCLGGKRKDIYLSLQEYFERLTTSEKWGKPVAALLGCLDAMADLEIAAIGGKDSMSGSYGEYHVPPTVIAFAAAPAKIEDIRSRAFQKAGSALVLLKPETNDDGIPTKESLRRIFSELEEKRDLILSAAPFKGAQDLNGRGAGNGFDWQGSVSVAEKRIGAVLIETDHPEEFSGISIGTTVAGHPAERTSIYDDVYGAREIEPIEKRETRTEKPEGAKGRKVLLLIFPGTNGETETRRFFEHQGFDVSNIAVREEPSLKDNFEEEFESALSNADILAIPGGAYGGDYRGRYGKLFLLKMKDIVEAFIAGGGKIVGFGEGLLSLIESGLIEEEKVTGRSDIRIFENPKGNFYHNVLFAEGNLTGRYTTAAALRYGIIETPREDLVLSRFEEYFPGATAIDGMISPKGKVLGFLSRPERIAKDTLINIFERKPLDLTAVL